MSAKSKVITAAVVLAIIIAAAVFMTSGTGDGDNAANGIEYEKVKRADLILSVVATGVITPEVEVTVKSKAGGEILSFPFNEGDELKRGQTVVKLDPETERARANQAEAARRMAGARLNRARISLTDAGTRLERSSQLYKDGIISAQELDDAKLKVELGSSDVRLYEAELFQSTEALKEAKERLADTEIRSPMNGTILNKFVDAGQVISSTLSSASEGTPLFTMANLENIFVAAQVDEVDISRIKPGLEALVRADSLPGRTFTGAVVRVAPKGVVERTVTVFEVIVEITDEGKAELKPGMTSDVEIITDRRLGVLLIKNESLRTRDKETGVYVAGNGEPVWRKISTGKTDGLLIEVTSGLTEGERVVTSGWPKRAPKKERKRGIFF